MVGQKSDMGSYGHEIVGCRRQIRASLYVRVFLAGFSISRKPSLTHCWHKARAVRGLILNSFLISSAVIMRDWCEATHSVF